MFSLFWSLQVVRSKNSTIDSGSSPPKNFGKKGKFVKFRVQVRTERTSQCPARRRPLQPTRRFPTGLQDVPCFAR